MMAKVSQAYHHNKTNNKIIYCKLLSFGTIIFLTGILIFKFLSSSETDGLYTSNESNVKIVKAATWNIAAINNNPFEYWITNNDPKYNYLMKNVSNFIENPGNYDISVKEVFTNAMFEELAAQMSKIGWTGIDKTREYWLNDYQNRKIVSEFIKDGLIGKKRLTSMPDRITNTINTIRSDKSSATIMRPTVINCYSEGDLSDINQWWKQWMQFYFNKSINIKKDGKVITSSIYQMIPKIQKSKYPSITTEEELVSIPLQTMSIAIFDAILIHMMNIIGKNTWQPLRQDMCMKLNLKKNDRTIEILEETYNDSDIIFLQEVAGNFPSFIKLKTISKEYDLLQAASMDEDRDQNSFILVKKQKFQDYIEVTDQVIELYQKTNNGMKLPVVNGDLVVVIATQISDNDRYILASFHGDTNGLATKPVVTAVQNYAMIEHPDCKILFGLDANTYAKPELDQQGVLDFSKFYTNLKLNSCYGPNPNPYNFTTFHARTHLQTQLNKAVSLEEKDIKGDKNPKDFILFFNADFQVLSTNKDNTGYKKYIEGMVFPTLTFPSDHGVTSTVLLEIAPISSSNLRKTEKL